MTTNCILFIFFLYHLPFVIGAAERADPLDELKQEMRGCPNLETRRIHFDRLTEPQKQAVSLQLQHHVRSYNSANNFFYGRGAACVKELREAGYGEVFDVLVAAGEPFYLTLAVGEQYQRYCVTREECILDEVTQLYLRTIEQQYPYTGAYLLGTLGGIKDGWAGRYMEWWDDTDSGLALEREYWAIQYRLKPAFKREKNVFFRHLKGGILKLYGRMKALEEAAKKREAERKAKEEAERRKPPEQKAEEARIVDERVLMGGIVDLRSWLTSEEFLLKPPSEQDRLRKKFFLRIEQDKKSIKEVLDDRRVNHYPVGRAFLNFAIAEGIIPAEERDQYRIREVDPIIVGEAPGDRKRPREDDGSGAGAAE
ncbi:MAG: hypothetical protein Q8Q56_02470 [Alphaproteobacteria bacterium]|nr:hypothetical protein [Alphaproteobacteria bacterium]